MVLGSARQIQDAVSLRDLLGLFDRFRNPYSPAEWLTRAVASSGRHDAQDALLWFGIVLGISALAYVPVLMVSGGMYYEGWLKMQSAAQRSELKRNWLPWSRTDRAIDLNRPSGLFRFLSPPTVAVLRKDLRVIPRDLTNMAQVLSPLAIGLFFVLQQLLYPVRFGSEDLPQDFVVPLLSMLSAGVAAGVSAMIMTRFGLTAFSFEGRSYWIIKSSPIGRRELVNAKFLAAYLPFLMLSGGLIILLEIARAFSDARLFGDELIFATLSAIDLPMMLYAFFVTAVVGAGTVAITLAIGAARPNMRWDTPHEMLTPDIGCMSIVLYGGYGAVTGVSLALPAAVSRFSVIEAPWLIWGWGLGAGLALTAIAVVGGLRVAAGELDAIGE
jgi:ABC-2 type transport system permease protein